MRWEELEAVIEEIAPLSLQEKWDNSGLQLLWQEREIHKVLICMEITDAVISEAVYGDFDAIITHHPLIFGTLSSIDCRKNTGRYISRLAAKQIAVYSTHTPFDKTEGGNNDYLAELLELKDVVAFTDGDDTELIGRVGRLKQALPLDKLVEYAADRLKLEPGRMRFTGKADALTEVIGICTGAGAELTELAIANGCDVLITGDLKYHQAQNALEQGFAIIDAGHYGTERFFTENFAKRLSEKTKGEISVVQSQVRLEPFSVF